MLDAARELFDTQGYQGTTIREIARHAGVSVGSVFTSFSSKGEILSQVMEERLDRLYAELDRVAPHLRGSTVDRLRSIYGIFFAFESPRTKLFLSHISAAFDWTLPATAKPYGSNERVRGLLLETLRKGVELGDVDPRADLAGYVEMLIAAYAWTYRLVVTQGADAKSMTETMDRQIALIAAGFAPRAS
ncbi:MAG: TetR/AcrR family transcriptional regulator [Alphaproteobacteria bacterium]|nr:TetR/AcrR family transcriptional regulator [Alphaproteobacteria bacterium]